MRVILYANVSANGKILLSENSNHQVPPEVLAAATKDIIQSGNLIMGRKSFENFEKVLGGASKVKEALPKVELVWLSKTKGSNDERTVASSPEEAVNHLAKRGFNDILVGGGTETYNAFLDSGLVTEVILNIVPIVSVGGILGLSDDLNLRFELRQHKLLTSSVIQLHFRKIKH